MNTEIFDNARACAYLLWEATGYDQAVELWAMAEDYALSLKQADIHCVTDIENLLALSQNDSSYISFIRNLAYRLSLCTKRHDTVSNWFTAERLVRKPEWRQRITALAEAFNKASGNMEKLSPVRNDFVRAYLLHN